MPSLRSLRRPKLITALIETFGFSPWLATAVALFLLLLGGAAILWVVLSAPPRAITLITGPAGSSFQRHAENYRKQLGGDVALNLVPSSGSLDNLQQLQDPNSGVDLGFVQGGLIGDKPPPPGLMSLGTIAYQPLWIFTRGEDRLALLSQLAGRRVAIGAPGSGVQALARALLEANGITGPPTTLVETPSEQAGRDFLAGNLDAIFLEGDSAPTATIRTLLTAPEVQVFTFTQADAYVRRLASLNLNKIVLPRGAIDLGRNLPAEDLTLIGPGVELIARKGLNSALSDRLLEAAQAVHGKPSLLAKRGEFPAPLDHEFTLSDDAVRYYKSGSGITYKLIDNFWLANLTNRLLVAIVPIFLVLIPAIRFLPVLYRWSVQLRIYRCYRPLLRLERDAQTPLNSTQAGELLERLDAIEADVNKLKVPASFASQFYDLRNHVGFVRNRLKAAGKT